MGHPEAGGRPGRGPIAGPVRIVILGPLAVVDPGVEGLLAPALEGRCRSYRPGGPRGIERVEGRTTMVTRRPDGRLAIPAGLVPRSVTVLERAGHRVELEDRTPARPCVRLDESRLDRGAPRRWPSRGRSRGAAGARSWPGPAIGTT